MRKINPKLMDYMTKGALYPKGIFICMIIILLIFVFCYNAFAIETEEASKFLGKRVEVRFQGRLKNFRPTVNIVGELLGIIHVYSYDYIILQGRDEFPALIPCVSIKYIKERRR